MSLIFLLRKDQFGVFIFVLEIKGNYMGEMRDEE